MQQNMDDLAARRKYFIFAGIAAGFLISAWYLFRLHLQKTMPGMPVKIDPVWAQFVNIVLIFFAAIFQCSLLHKLYVLVVRFMRRKRQG